MIEIADRVPTGLGVEVVAIAPVGERHMVVEANLLDGAAHFYDTYECADGKFVAVGPIEPQFYAEMLSVLGIDDPDFERQNDGKAWPALKERLATAFIARTRDEWAALFENTDACMSPVLDWDEAIAHPHNRERGSFVEIGGVVQPAPAPRFSRTQAEIVRPPAAAGEHTEEVLLDWGAGAEAVAGLRREGTI